jgi:hypothetical protein
VELSLTTPIQIFFAAENQLLCEVVDVDCTAAELLASFYAFSTKYARTTSMAFTALEFRVLEKASNKVVSSLANVLASFSQM